ncbi:MAG: hypothetical protein Q9M10_03985 [Mariprofundaceae bacterium]|nr:hypothetical protein [Mariprofundaceae bacterium]
MSKITWMLPLLLAGLVIASGFGFVIYYNAYEEPGEHWSPNAPIAHATARFATDMGAEGDYLVKIEKLSSKSPLFFIEYQTPGDVLDMKIHSDDGIVRLSQQFADEGQYRITVQHSIHPNHHEIIDFIVQTPLVKYTNDVLLFIFLVAAGFLSGKRLKALTMLVLVVSITGISQPQSAMAHGADGEHQVMEVSNTVDDIKLTWAHGKPPIGEANRTPMDWAMQLKKAGKPVTHASYDLDFVHLESGFPVLHIEGVTTANGLIELQYSPPDGTEYQLQLRTDIDGRVYHLALMGEAEAIRPTAGRKWASFLLMMVPVLLGMAWGWRRKQH